MHIVVAGGSGFLGRPLMRTLRQAGHEVTQLVRRPVAKPHQLTWDPSVPIELPGDAAAVINVGGAGVGDHRWTDKYKNVLRDSRLIPTQTLADAVTRQDIPVLINASGVGFYGDTGDREVDESAPAGDDFLARLAIDWEAAATSAQGARVVLLRTGMPLDRHGGLLKPQLLPFTFGVGGRLGSGRQWMPWLSLADWLRAVQFVLANNQISGPVNLVGPDPVTNAEFTRVLAKALHRPAVLPIPRLAIKVLLGGFADEILCSLRVVPKVLRDHGFTYEHPTLREALTAALRKLDSRPTM